MTVELGAFVVPDATEPAAVLDQVLAAERGGLDLIGIQDHPYQRRFLDTFSLLAFIAARTERVRLFPDVANLPLRDPRAIRRIANVNGVIADGPVEGWLRGPPEHWVAELGALAADHGFDGFVLWADGDMVEQIGRFAAEVAPALRAA